MLPLRRLITQDASKLFSFASMSLWLLFGTGCGGTGGSSSSPKPPAQIVLTSIGPYNALCQGSNWVVAGTGSFTLLASGTGFTPSSVIQWNGSPLPTTYGDSTSLDATVSASLVASPGVASITVDDPTSAVTSGSLPFGIASPAAATAGVVQMITLGSDGTAGNADSLVAPSISSTGRYVSFQSAATNLGAGVTSSYQQIYE
jgi:hypothetical protein